MKRQFIWNGKVFKCKQALHWTWQTFGTRSLFALRWTLFSRGKTEGRTNHQLLREQLLHLYVMRSEVGPSIHILGRYLQDMEMMHLWVSVKRRSTRSTALFSVSKKRGPSPDNFRSLFFRPSFRSSAFRSYHYIWSMLNSETTCCNCNQ